MDYDGAHCTHKRTGEITAIQSLEECPSISFVRFQKTRQDKTDSLYRGCLWLDIYYSNIQTQPRLRSSVSRSGFFITITGIPSASFHFKFQHVVAMKFEHRLRITAVCCK